MVYAIQFGMGMDLLLAQGKALDLDARKHGRLDLIQSRLDTVTNLLAKDCNRPGRRDGISAHQRQG